jgi:hypothetical protein
MESACQPQPPPTGEWGRWRQQLDQALDERRACRWHAGALRGSDRREGLSVLGWQPCCSAFRPNSAFTTLTFVNADALRAQRQVSHVTRFSEPKLAAVDNFVIGPQGEFFVTGFDKPSLAVINPDGSQRRLLHVGAAAER